MLENQGPGFQGEIDIFLLVYSGDISNLRFRQNIVLSCILRHNVRIFDEIWFKDVLVANIHSAVSELALYSTDMLI